MQVRYRSALAFLILISVLFNSGCGTRAVWDDDRHFEVSVPIEIDVESFSGDVTINTTEKWPGVRVRTRRAAVHGYSRSREAADSLDQITTSVDMAQGELGPKLIVRTHTDHAEPHFQRVHLHIDVPQAENITIRTQRGEVRMTGVSGEIYVETTDGDVRLLTNRALNKPITILNQRGSIFLRMRGESMGFLDAEAVRGEVTRQINYGHLTVEPTSRHNRFRGTLNDGGNPITLRTADGNIRISVVHNPEQVGRFIIH